MKKNKTISIFIIIFTLSTIFFYLSTNNGSYDRTEKTTPNSRVVNIENSNKQKIKLQGVDKKPKKAQKSSINNNNLCVDKISMALSHNIARERISKIKELLFELDTRNIPITAVNEVLTRSGIGKNRGYQILNEYYHQPTVPVIPRDALLFNEDELTKITAKINEKKFDSLFEEIANNNSLIKKVFIIDGEIKTLGSLLFKNEKSEYFNTFLLKYDQLELPIYLQDLIEFTLSGLNLASLSGLINNFEGNLNSKFYFKGSIHNLATLSAAYNLPNQLNFWLKNGVLLEVRKYGKNAFDYYLESPITNNENRIISIFNHHQLIPTTTDNLKKYFSLINQHDINENRTYGDYKDIINNYILEIFNIVSKDVDYPEGCRISESEFKSIVEKVFFLAYQVKEIIESDEVKIELSTNTDNNKVKINKENQVRYSDNEKVEIEKLVQLIDDGKWRDVIDKKAAQFGITEQEKLAASLSLAIVSGCQEKDIIEILTHLNIIEQSIAKPAVKYCKVNTLNHFFRKGVTFDYVYEDGSTAILSAVVTKEIEKLNYLISVGVSINNINPTKKLDESNYDTDPLSFALSAVPFDTIYIEIINILLLNGAIVNDRHVKICRKIAQFDFDSYLGLIDKFPQLK